MQRILPALRILLFALATLWAGLITGCGLKGDLVLPDPAEPAGEAGSGQEEDTEAQDSGEHQQ